MKKLITFLLLYNVVSMMVMQGCNKDKNDPAPEAPNQPPVAIAGNDTIALFDVCDNTTKITLDGSHSYDPERVDLSFIWKQIYGPPATFEGNDSTHNSVTALIVTKGDYQYELLVTDWKGLTSKDTVSASVSSTKELMDVDLDVNGTVEYTDNYQDFYYPDIYYDAIYINGTAVITNELYNYYFNVTADSTFVNTSFRNDFSFVLGVGGSKYLVGNCNVDFDSLYVNGGGAFDGTITLTSGSAYVNCSTKPPGAPQLEIAGNMDAASSSISMKIKGKIMF